MRGHNTIILDMTGETALAGIISDVPSELKMVEGFASDLRVVIGRVDGQFHVWAGAQSQQPVESVRPLVFEHLNEYLPRIEDEDLQSIIFAALWRHLCEGWSKHSLIGREARLTAYVIVQNHPVPALGRFRAACATEERIRLAAFPNEAASLVIGAIEYEKGKDFDASRSSAPARVCLIVAYTDRRVEVCSFEHMVVDDTRHRIFIRDFFRTGIADLGAELPIRDWSEDRTDAVVFGSSSLSARSQKSLLQAVSGSPWKTAQNQPSPGDLLGLKIRGAAYLARNAGDRSGEPIEYEIETAFNIGFAAEGEEFQPILTQLELTGAIRYPVTSSRAFRLSSRPTNDVAIRARCGYSNRVEESTILGELKITGLDIDELFRNKQGALSALVTLESAGKGEFSLEILPAGRTIGTQTFNLPGLMA